MDTRIKVHASKFVLGAISYSYRTKYFERFQPPVVKRKLEERAQYQETLQVTDPPTLAGPLILTSRTGGREQSLLVIPRGDCPEILWCSPRCCK